MTKNLERVREIVDKLRVLQKRGQYIAYGSVKHQKEIISQALTQVEDEAYERAAKVALKWEWPGIAQEILNLRSKGKGRGDG